MNKNKESKAEKLMSIIELNKAKNGILKEIKDLDMFGKINSRECNQLIELYKYTCSMYNKKMYNLSKKKKMDLLILIKDLIPDFINNKSILSMINLENQKLVISKTLIDLGGVEFHLYNKENPNRINLMQHIMNILNIENNDIEEVSVNEEVVNNYMVSDFLNML